MRLNVVEEDEWLALIVAKKRPVLPLLLPLLLVVVVVALAAVALLAHLPKFAAARQATDLAPSRLGGRARPKTETEAKVREEALEVEAS